MPYNFNIPKNFNPQKFVIYNKGEELSPEIPWLYDEKFRLEIIKSTSTYLLGASDYALEAANNRIWLNRSSCRCFPDGIYAETEGNKVKKFDFDLNAWCDVEQMPSDNEEWYCTTHEMEELEQTEEEIAERITTYYVDIPLFLSTENQSDFIDWYLYEIGSDLVNEPTIISIEKQHYGKMHNPDKYPPKLYIDSKENSAFQAFYNSNSHSDSMQINEIVECNMGGYIAIFFETLPGASYDPDTQGPYDTESHYNILVLRPELKII